MFKLTWAFYSLIVIRVDADFFLFGSKWIVTYIKGFEFVMALQVGPSPHATVYNMGQSFTMGHLKAAI